MHLLAISGSLRSKSSNSALIHAAVRVLPPGTTHTIFEALALLPAFSPDADTDPAPPPVAVLRAQLSAADAVLISSPEYAHGVPGALKNALDWTVGSGDFVNKPVAIVNTSVQSRYVTEQLRETLTVMMGRVVVAESLPLSVRPDDATGLLADEAAAAALRSAIATLLEAATQTV
jgi:chromate reductase, NAD(P)H dehydrogenase (quinone)